MNVSWTATLSNGRTVSEKHDYPTIAGERKPWIRFINDLEPGEYLTSLRLNVGQRTVHMPRLRPLIHMRPTMQPRAYSIEYIMEVDNVMAARTERHFMDIATYFGAVSVHYLIDMNGNKNSWIEVRHQHDVHPDAITYVQQ